jgi:hypothetical protein
MNHRSHLIFAFIILFGYIGLMSHLFGLWGASANAIKGTFESTPQDLANIMLIRWFCLPGVISLVVGEYLVLDDRPKKERIGKVLVWLSVWLGIFAAVYAIIFGIVIK